MTAAELPRLALRMPCAVCRTMTPARDLAWIRSPIHQRGRRRAGAAIPRVGCRHCAQAGRT